MMNLIPPALARGLLTGCATAIFAAVLVAAYGLGYWHGVTNAYNDPLLFERFQLNDETNPASEAEGG